MAGQAPLALPRPAGLAVAAALLVAGCTALLPTGHEAVTSPWRSFEEARDALERVEPGRTTAAELRGAGFDPYATPNVQLLTFSDIVLRFPVGAGLSIDQLDSGLRACLRAGKACQGYAVNVKEVRRERHGNYWQDAFGFKRVTDVTGWTFNALVLLVDDRVVYTLYGGQPQVREQEVTRQPLGPLQEWGRSISPNDLIK